MANQIVGNPNRVLDGNGYTVPGAKMTVYQSGTATLLPVYSDQVGTVAAANPIIADANGVFPQRYVTAAAAKVVITTADDVPLYTLDPAPIVQSTGAGASQISFAPSVTVPVTNVQDAIDLVAERGRYGNVQAFGAVGDGVTDDTAALQAALDEGGLLFVPKGTYRVTGQLTINSNTTLEFEPGAVVDATAFPTGTFVEVINCDGTLGTATALTSNRAPGARFIPVASVAGLAAGDWILISSNQTVGPTQGEQGEIQQIKAISSLTLELEAGIFDTYDTADTAVVQKVTFKENIRILGGRFVAGGEVPNLRPAIRLNLVRNVEVIGTEIDGFWRGGMQLVSCIHFTVSDCKIYETNRTLLGYSILCQNACQYGTITRNFAARVGKLWDCGSEPGQKGMTRFVNVHDNRAYDYTRNSAISTHCAGEYINIYDNFLSGESGESFGIFIRTANTTVKNNVILQPLTTGIQVTNLGRPGYIEITGNVIRRAGSNGIIVIQNTGDFGGKITSVLIDGNTVDAAAIGIGVINDLSGVSLNDVSVSNNAIVAGNEGIDISCLQGSVADGVITGNRCRLQSGGSGGNGGIVLNNDGGGDAGRFVITGNMVVNPNRGIRDRGAINCWVDANFAQRPSNIALAIDGWDAADLGTNRTLG